MKKTINNIYPETKLKIAIAQTKSLDGHIEENIKTAINKIEYASKQGADIIVFPEKFLTGYVPEMIETNIGKYTITNNDARLELLYKACKDNKISAIIGAPTRINNDLFISSIVINQNGEEQARYNKTHLFYTEKSQFKNDDKLVIIKIKDWNIGLAICYDVAFPEHSRALAKAGCHVYLASTLFSKGTGFLESRVWFAARALDNTIFSVMCNHVGKTGKWDATGKSAVWNPYGQLIKEASQDNEEVLIVELDPKLLKEAREAEKMLEDSFDLQKNYMISIE